MNSSELQIWINNDAFDNGENENRKTGFVSDHSDFPDSTSSKENRSPIPAKTPATAKHLQKNPKLQETGEIRDEKKIDSEMEEIKKEITSLTSRLEALRLEKAELKIKALEKLGRMVPAKFKEQKQGVKKVGQPRGFSLGPSEISGGIRRGISMGPAEIYSASKSRQLGKQETTFTPANRRKSCFFKPLDVDEEKAATTFESKQRRKTLVQRQAATTVGSKKEASRIVGQSPSSSSSSIQPKKLFSKGDKSQPIKPMPGRVVASRYNQSCSAPKSAIRKRSLEETTVKKTVNPGESLLLSEKGTRKKRWEIPSEIVIQGNVFDEASPRAILMPKRIRTVRSGVETPRDSGPAKRVVDLVGRKSFFHDEEDDDELSVQKMLSFGEEEEDDTSTRK